MALFSTIVTHRVSIQPSHFRGAGETVLLMDGVLGDPRVDLAHGLGPAASDVDGSPLVRAVPLTP